MDFSELVEAFNELEGTTKRLRKTYILSELLKKTPKTDIEEVLMLVEGRVFPKWDERVIGISDQLAIKIISTAAGASTETIKKKLTEEGDLGKVVKSLMGKQKQMTLTSTELTIKKVFDNLQKLASIEGKGSIDKKVSLVAELLTSANPDEAKFLIKIVLGNLRIGIASGSIRDAIVWAVFGDEIAFDYHEKNNTFDVDREKYDKYVKAAEHSYNITNDFGKVAILAKEKGLKGLEESELIAGSPLNVMLYQKAKGIEDAFKMVGKPAACEYKFDGFHAEIHNDGKEIKIFTRRLDDVTKQFPDVVKAVKENVTAKTYILDAEIVGYDPKTKQYQPFQAISQRIRRKYDIEEIATKFPVEVVVFDVLLVEGESTLHEPFAKRTKYIKEHVKMKKGAIRPAQQIITDKEDKVQEFYEKSLAEGQEGIMMKNLEGEYKPGNRVGFGVKIKPILEPLDVVIVGAEHGEGKRSKWFSSFKIAIRDGNQFLEIGKVGTGVKEKTEGLTFEELTNELTPLIIEEKGKEVRVKAKIVLEVAYEEIQRSTNYNSGFALRFPRVLRMRPDKSVGQISTLREVKSIYTEQRGRDGKE